MAEVPVGFGVQLVLAMLAAEDPGLGFGTGKHAEAVVLVQQPDIGARGGIVTTAQVVVDFQVGGGDGKGLGLVAEAPASAGAALKVWGQYPVVACVGTPGTKTHLPGKRRKEGVSGAQRADFHAGELFQLELIVVGIKSGVQSQELQLGSGAVAE